MIKLQYPTAFSAIGQWATENRIAITEAKFRYAQYGVLRAIASSRQLSQTIVLKGGNALDFVWQPNRSTVDLDFSSLVADLSAETIKRLLMLGLRRSGDELGIGFRVQSVKQQPPGENRTFVTFAIKVGYGLPDAPRNRARIEQSEDVSSVVLVELSLNEEVCESVKIEIDAANPLQVSTLEDIVSEKLRALLQQPIRNRYRRQDLLDIAVSLRQSPELDLHKVAQFLQRKAAGRNVLVSRQAFHNEEIKAKAEKDYNELQGTTRTMFVPFAEAYIDLLALVDDLEIPEDV